MSIEPIKVTGLAEFNRNLRKINADLPKTLRLANNDAAGIIVDTARPQVPRRSGRASGTVKARSTRTDVRVQGGSARAPYYPWLDFGGRVGRQGSVKRPFYTEGRYIYPSYYNKQEEFVDLLATRLLEVARAAGVEVDG